MREFIGIKAPPKIRPKTLFYFEEYYSGIQKRASVRVRRDTTSRYGPGALAEMEAALREDRGMAEDAVTYDRR